MKNKQENKFERKNFEFYKDIYLKTIVSINDAYKIGMSDYIIQKNLKFIEVCYNYYGTIHGLEDYLKNKSYIIHSNLGDVDLFGKEIEKQKENLKSGAYLIGYYFKPNTETKIDRFIFGGKGSLLKIHIKKYSKKFIDLLIPNPLPDGI